MLQTRPSTRRPQDGQCRRRFRHSSMLLCTPANIIRKPTPVVATNAAASCGSSVSILRSVPRQAVYPSNSALPRMRVRLEIQLPAAPVGYVRVELRGGEVGMAEHLLDAAEVGAALEEVRGEAVAEQVRVHPRGVEAGLCGEPPNDQERSGAGERAAAGVEEELRPVPGVQVRPAARDVARERLRGVAADRDDPLLVALADAADQALVEIHRVPREADRLAHAQPCAVEELDYGAVAKGPRGRARGGLDQPLGLAGRQRPGEPAQPPR